MIPRNSDLLDYRNGLYAGKSMPLETQLFFVENALRADGVIAGQPEAMNDAECVITVRAIRAAMDEVNGAKGQCDDAVRALRELLKGMKGGVNG